jgi:anhydro-N-acetylmuramic acid kinase
MDAKEKYRVIGLMSGTSLDGIDVASCIFRRRSARWEFQIEMAKTVPYSTGWMDKLSSAHTVSAEDLMKLHVDYGSYLGNMCKKFIKLYDIKRVDFIASHGHTVFHQPEKKFTFQLGEGNAIHAASNLPVIFDFRSLDIALGGQGAPLVPAGDHFLFPTYDVCLNIGGIANLSQQVGNRRVAFDICFANMGLNYLSLKAGKAYDRNGALASDGNLDVIMLTDLNQVYANIRRTRPALGREFFEKQLRPILDRENVDLIDRLHTFTESIAIQIASALNIKTKRLSVLCTGGGAFNSYLLYRMIEHFGDRVDLIVPDPEIIKFKEAMVFAFLGVRRLRNEVNCLKSVTQASRDSSSGVLIGF